MRILILSQYWFPENGVPQRRWSWLTRILVEAGHNVRVVAPPPHYLRHPSVKEWLRETYEVAGSLESGPSGEKIRRSMYLPAGNSLTGRALNQASVAVCMALAVFRSRSTVKRFSPDLVIGTVPALPTAVVTQVIAKLIKAPYIIDLRDAWPDLLMLSDQWNDAVGKQSLREKILSKGPKQLVLSAVSKSLLNSYKSANAMIVTSELLGKHLSSNTPRSAISADKITCIRNVFPVETPIPEATGSCSKDGELHVLYAGTMGRAQKLQNVLEAIKLAQSRGLCVRAKFVGAGVAKDSLRAFSEKNQLPVEFHSRVEANKLADFYNWADTALVHLADWEPLSRAVPSKTYELMEAGIHITAAVAGETTSIVNEQCAGVTVVPEVPEALVNAWAELIEDKDLLNIADTGREWVHRERTVVSPARLLELVEETVKRVGS